MLSYLFADADPCFTGFCVLAIAVGLVFAGGKLAYHHWLLKHNPAAYPQRKQHEHECRLGWWATVQRWQGRRHQEQLARQARNRQRLGIGAVILRFFFLR
jgi:hypothetical protein